VTALPHHKPWVSAIRHHGLELSPTQKQSVVVTGQRAEIPTPIEGSGLVIEAVEDHRDEGEGLAGVVAIPQRLGEQAAPKSMTLIGIANAEPSQDSNR